MSYDRMSDTVIRVEDVSKVYRIGQLQPYATLRDAVSRAVLALFRATPSARLDHKISSGSPAPEAFVWALRNVSFDVSEGEAVGIIGRNGSGKTTLLKILSRITKPTEGRAEVTGRVGSLLEVGTGFHPELTGRENIYLYGAVLGMKRSEIDDRFDEIVSFAEVEKFMDTPLKRYSSGMQVRLAFAVAAHLEPEILLVDEVLAVGDAAFQRKCLGRMGTVAREGRTVLFVSHNMGAVRDLTQTCLYLVDGRIEAYGNSAQVIEQYMTQTLTRSQEHPDDLDFYRRNKNVDAAASFARIWVGEDRGSLCEIPVGGPFTVYMSLEANRRIEGASITINIKKLSGRVIATVLTADSGFGVNLPVGNTTLACRINDLCLMPGTYVVDVGVNRAVGAFAWDVIIDYPAFRVVNEGPQMLAFRPDRPGLVVCDDVHWYDANVGNGEERNRT